jgi:hypothetical protein
MSSVADILRTTAAGFVPAGAEISTALGTLGPDIQRSPSDLTGPRKLHLADQFVRNLRSLPQERVAALARTLFPLLGAEVEPVWRSDLSGNRSVVEVRKQLRLMLMAAGLPWASMARLQACVCMLVDWVGSAGGGAILLERIPHGVRVQLTTTALGGDAALLSDSPMVSALRQHTPDVDATGRGTEILLQFSLTDWSA